MIRKYSILILLVFLCFGYRWRGSKWKIESSDDVINVQVCDDFDFDLGLENNFPSDDALANTAPTVRSVIQAAVDRINNFDKSFVHLVVDSGEAPSDRYVELCYGTAGGLSTGAASTNTEGRTILNCNIVFENTPTHAKNFSRLFSHELGHCLGLDHPNEQTSGVMSRFTKAGIYRFGIDDLMAMAHIYPAEGYSHREEPSFGLACTPR